MENQTIRDFIAPTVNHMDGSVGGFAFSVVYDGSTPDVPNNTPLTTYYDDKYLGLTRGFDVVTTDGGRTYKPADATIAFNDFTECTQHYLMTADGEPKMLVYFHDGEMATGNAVPSYEIVDGALQVTAHEFAPTFDEWGALQGWNLC